MTWNPMMKDCVARLALPDKFAVLELGSQTMTAGEKMTVPEYYESLGAETYDALDFDGKGTILWDLNEVWRMGMGKYDLVTNNGTGEHIFDQAAVFTTMHNSCKVGGVMLHVMPFIWWLNHGFYNFHPGLYRDIAAANDYEILWCRLGERNGYSVELPASGFEGVTPSKPNPDLLRTIEDVMGRASHQPNIMICVAMRKAMNGVYNYPIRGRYGPVSALR